MPWMREGKCVYKKNADGSKGESAGCSDTVEMAKTHMRSLYANAEKMGMKPDMKPGSKPTMNKAAGDIWALFPLGAQLELVAAQENIAEQVADFVPVDPESFHITAVYSNGTDILGLNETLQYDWWRAFPVIVDGIDSFETPEGYAVYLRVRPDYLLGDMQSMLFSALTRNREGFVSTYSIPNNWIAHITMGYSQSKVGALEFDPFAVICTSIEIGDENHLPIMDVELKAVDEMAIVEKSFPIEIIAKSVRFNEEGDLVIPIIGQPFRGPMKGVADLEGDFFHAGTQLPAATEYATFWDHGRDEVYLKKELKELKGKGILSDEEIVALGGDFGFGKGDIAKAVRRETTADGVMYDIIFNRHAKYLKALERAAREGLIGGSGEYKHFVYDLEVAGKVDYAAMVGMALTPSPMNIEARVLKAVSLETDDMANAKVTKKVEDAAAVDPAPVTEAVIEKKPTMVEAIKAKAAEIAAIAADEAAEPEGIDASELVADTTALLEEVKALRLLVTEQKAAFEEFREEMTLALPELGEMIAAQLQGAVGEYVAKSKIELRAENKGQQMPAPIRQNSISKSASPSAPAGVLHNKSASMANFPGSN